MSKNTNKRTTKRKSTTENSVLKFLTVSFVSSDSIVKGIIDDIMKTAVKTAEVVIINFLLTIFHKLFLCHVFFIREIYISITELQIIFKSKG
jgi:hypothetical protein